MSIEKSSLFIFSP